MADRMQVTSLTGGTADLANSKPDGSITARVLVRQCRQHSGYSGLIYCNACSVLSPASGSRLDYPGGLTVASSLSRRKRCQIIGRVNSGVMCNTTMPFWKMRTLPDDWLTTTATARVFFEMAAADQ